MEFSNGNFKIFSKISKLNWFSKMFKKSRNSRKFMKNPRFSSILNKSSNFLQKSDRMKTYNANKVTLIECNMFHN